MNSGEFVKSHALPLSPRPSTSRKKRLVLLAVQEVLLVGRPLVR